MPANGPIEGVHWHMNRANKIKASDDCKACHLILAQGSDEQLEKLNARGYDFVHIDAEYSEFSCAECHTGAAPKGN